MWLGKQQRRRGVGGGVGGEEDGMRWASSSLHLTLSRSRASRLKSQRVLGGGLWFKNGLEENRASVPWWRRGTTAPRTLCYFERKFRFLQMKIILNIKRKMTTGLIIFFLLSQTHSKTPVRLWSGLGNWKGPGSQLPAETLWLDAHIGRRILLPFWRHRSRGPEWFRSCCGHIPSWWWRWDLHP